jgi:predicted DNA-binding antitoxin AbrB/MazE fold protein
MMSAPIEAIFEGGVFRPLQPIDLPEGERVQITVSSSDVDDDPAAHLPDIAIDLGVPDDPYTLPPLITDETERARLLQETVQEMKNHPLVGDPPPLTRDELHERR